MLNVRRNRSWRSFIFYAYTGRVAFAPLRSQGFVYHDDGKDAAQLPICSPKSMYRLAAKVSELCCA